MSSRRRAGLGKSLENMFGEDKLRSDFKKLNERENINKNLEQNREDFSQPNNNKNVTSHNDSSNVDNKPDNTSNKNIYNNINNDISSNTINYSNNGVDTNTKNNIQNNSNINFNNDSINENYQKENNLNINTNDSTKQNNQSLFNVKINLLQPNIHQPRKNFDEEKLNELAESINKYGLLQPILVKQNGPLYEIIAGERRWRAAKIAGLETVPVQLKQYDKKTTTEVALIENIQRENLNAVEEAMAYQSLINDYGLSQEEVAQRVSKNRSTIANSLRILKLNDDILEMIKDGKLSAGHARALLSIDDEELREKISYKVIEQNLNVRDIEKLVRLENLANWRKEKTAEKNAEKNSEKNIQLLVILKDLEKKMKNKLGTKVKILQKDENEGKIEIKYFSKEDLDRIWSLINSIKEY